MADSDLVPFGAAIAGDVLSLLAPGGGTLSAIATAYVAKKRKEAAEILIKEIEAGHHRQIDFDEHDIEPLIEMVLRFAKAVSDGAARENLVFLAQVISGLKKMRAFEPDLFRRWCRILEGLTRDELLVVGFACRLAANSTDSTAENDFNSRIRTELKEAGYSDGETEALLTRVASTGLLSSASAWGGLVYQPTPWLGELKQLVDVEGMAGKRDAPADAAT